MSTFQHTINCFCVARTCESAKVPTRGSVYSAGFDLSASKATIVPAHGKALVDTGLKMSLPVGTYGRIAPRSGLAWKKHIDVGAGVIDRDYRGEVRVVLFNHGDEDFTVAEGDRVAQLVLERIAMVDVMEVPVVALGGSVRGGDGFGSTGTTMQANLQALGGREQFLRDCAAVATLPTPGVVHHQQHPQRVEEEDLYS